MNNIKIFTRIKPNINNNADTCVFKQNNSVIVKKKQKAYLQNYIVDCNYKLDKVFDDKCDNMDIYNHISSQNLLLPVIEEKNKMNFFPWKKNEVLQVNKYGMLEPMKSKQSIPNVMLVPLLAFDNNKFRLGYGKGYYDRYLNKYIKTFKNILTVGVAFSFQKYHKLPINDKDIKLNYILTEKGIY